MLDKYLNFDLLLDRAANHFQARVLKSPAGEAVENFALPFSDQDLEIYLLKLGAVNQNTRRVRPQQGDLAQEFGSRLFEAVCKDSVLTCLSVSQAVAEEQNAGLRLRLRLGEDAELTRIPWEFLYNQARNEFFALSLDAPLVRYLDIDRSVRPLSLPTPLRILLMLSNAQANSPLNVVEEEARLRQALSGLIEAGLVEITRLPVATLDALQTELARRDYHVLHYVGHGDFDAGRDEGVLYLQDRFGQPRAVSGQALGVMLQGYNLRLAVLNACFGGQMSSHQPFSGVAQSLVQIGLPAVVAMQFEISDGGAILFAQRFYESVARQCPVDVATVHGRKALFAEGGLEWGTPVIYLRAENGRIFQIQNNVEAVVSSISDRVVSTTPQPATQAQVTVGTGAYGGAGENASAVEGVGSAPEAQEAELRDLVAEAKREIGDSRPKVVLLYKRKAQPDEMLVQFLETQLAAAGCDVFLDRHLIVGTRWAEEVNRKIREAEAIIPILSMNSVKSEMLEYELQTAAQVAQIQGGRPHLLPVRVAYEDPLPAPLASILNPIQYTLWEGPQDNVRLIRDVFTGLHTPAPTQDPILLESPGGAVPKESRFYVERPVDKNLEAALARRDGTILIKGARQMGKTSLMARGLDMARKQGALVAYTDFQMLGAKHLASAESLLQTLATMLASDLNASNERLQISARSLWDEDLPPQSNMNRFMTHGVFRAFSEPLVWFMDEVDRLFACDYASEIFGFFRAWHNRREVQPDPWKRLTLVISYATEAHLFITDLTQSPFNVGTDLQMEDFTLAQVRDLNLRYNSPLRNEEELTRFYRLVNGQPYLVRRGLNEMVQKPLDIAALEADAEKDQGVFGDHLRRILISLSHDPELTEVVRQVLKGGQCPNEESFFRLRAAGVLSGDTFRKVQLRCHLYAAYLTRHLVA